MNEHRPALEREVLDRIEAISTLAENGNRVHSVGVRSTAEAALDYAFEVIARDEDRLAPPSALLARARLAADDGASLEVVLRCYFAGYALLGDFLVRHAWSVGPRGAMPSLQLQNLAAAFDRLLSGVSTEFARAAETPVRPSDQRLASRVKRLLLGELTDSSDLAHPFGHWQLGIVATCHGAPQTLRNLSSAFEYQLLLVRPDERTVWAWLASPQPLDVPPVIDWLAERSSPDLTIACGEPAEGLPGWRLSHRQALAAMPVAARLPIRRARYADVALLAAALQDDVLSKSLYRIYLAPLEQERDGGLTLRRTLAAYFASSRNASSAAAKLQVSRNTVSVRLRSVEDRLGRPVDAWAAELDTALRLFGLEDS